MKPARTLRQRITFIVTGALLPLVILGIAAPTVFGARFMDGLIAPDCGGDTVPPVAYEDISFPSAEFPGRETPAYFIPADESQGEAIIVLPTGNAGRGDRMDEIAVYHDAGINVLSYRSRACVGN